jgi:uncharacterized metal-binding protein
VAVEDRRKLACPLLVEVSMETDDKRAPGPRCADCGFPRQVKACTTPPGRSPEFCPMRTHERVISESLQLYDDPETRKFSRQASLQEAEGYADRHDRPFVKRPCKTRIEEIWEFAHRMGYSKLGLAYCVGLIGEARIVARIFAAHDLEVSSVMCKVGAVPKEHLGLKDEDKIRAGQHESICNPITQAELLNRAGTELNVLLGLCVGHDALFLKHSEAPCTVLAVKDRVTGHNPLAAVYTAGSYYDRLKGEPR